ncbi:hypothetical protein KTE56_24735 [Burkholderia multivorans]|nr:hypothetical protein [Burkholderia multivorans]MBU9509635.1 hypothetical protein [Burkholderia multivorans]
MNSVKPPPDVDNEPLAGTACAAPAQMEARLFAARDHFDPGPERRLGLAEKFHSVLRDLLVCFNVERNDS